MGRFRSYLFFGTIICCVNFILVWFGSVWAPAGKLIIAYITYLLLGATFDLMDIPLSSMIAVMTDSSHERNLLSAVKGISYRLGFYALIFSAVVVVLVLPSSV